MANNKLNGIANQLGYSDEFGTYDDLGNVIDYYKGLSPTANVAEPSPLAKLADNAHSPLDREIMLNSEEDYWNSVIVQKPELLTKIQNIRAFPREVIGDAVRYQIPITHDDGTVDQSWRTMDLALEDYDYIYDRTALSNP